MYRLGDVVQYERGSKAEGIERGSFGVVRSTDAVTKRLVVELQNGSAVAYDPKRISGATSIAKPAASSPPVTGSTSPLSIESLGFLTAIPAPSPRSRLTASPFAWMVGQSALLLRIHAKL